MTGRGINGEDNKKGVTVHRVQLSVVRKEPHEINSRGLSPACELAGLSQAAERGLSHLSKAHSAPCDCEPE